MVESDKARGNGNRGKGTNTNFGGRDTKTTEERNVHRKGSKETRMSPGMLLLVNE